MSKDQPNQRWLLIRHSQKHVEDRCSRWLQMNNIDFDECSPIVGDDLPRLPDYTHLVVYGGIQQIYTDKQPAWMLKELRLVESALQQDIRCLGICLGGQLLAHVLGARVQPHPQRLREVGYQWVHPTNSADKFLKHSSRFLQWHSAGFDLPEQCIHLASSELFECQAFQHPSKSYGLQFHPEVTTELLRVWQQRHKDSKAAWLKPADRLQHRRDSLHFNRQVTYWFEDFLEKWAI